jgi:hypothetical protein
MPSVKSDAILSVHNRLIDDRSAFEENREGTCGNPGNTADQLKEAIDEAARGGPAQI